MTEGINVASEKLIPARIMEIALADKEYPLTCVIFEFYLAH